MFSGRINSLRIWTSNNDPKIIGKFYFDYLFESRGKCVNFNVREYVMRENMPIN